MLVTILVITYNSEKTIIATLDSIKNQTYKNFELIISDDNSKDNTVSSIKRWSKENPTINTILIENNINTGVTPNVNRGLKRANGIWVKLIAGDDLLKKGCLEDNVNCITLNPNIKALFSKARDFTEENGLINYLDVRENFLEKEFFLKGEKEQYLMLLKENPVVAPTGFLNLDLLKKIGYCDEKYNFMEDYPLWLKLTKNGIKLYFLDKETVLYRMHNQSIMNSQKVFVNAKFFEGRKFFYYNEIKPFLGKKEILFKWHKEIEILKNSIGIYLFKNKRNRVTSIIYKMINLISPYSYYIYFKRGALKWKK